MPSAAVRPAPAAAGGAARVAPAGPKSGVPALLHVLPVGIYTVGPDHTLLSINPEAARLTGVVPEQVIGKRCDEVLACSFCDEGGGCAAEQARACGEMSLDGPVEMRRADGTRVKVRIDAVPLSATEVAVTLREEGPGGGATPAAAPVDGHSQIREALTRAAGSVTLAARLLGVHRTTLWRWMTEAGLDRKAFIPS